MGDREIRSVSGRLPGSLEEFAYMVIWKVRVAGVYSCGLTKKKCLLANSHAGSIKRRRRKSITGRRASVSSEKAVKDEENSSLPEVEEGNEAKLSYVGLEEGKYTCISVRLWI